MMPDKFEQKRKAFIAMEKEYREIRDLIYAEEVLIPFDKPVHKGWTVSIELRDDIARRVDAPLLQRVVKLAFATRHIRNAKHVRMMRAGHKGYYYTNRKGIKDWMSFDPGQRRIKKKEYDTFPPEIQRYFYLDVHARYMWDRETYLSWIPSYWKVLKVRPYFVTHYVAKGGPLYKRQAYLDYKLDEYYRTSGNSYRRTFPGGSYRATTRNLITKFIKREIEDIPHEKVHYIWD